MSGDIRHLHNLDPIPASFGRLKVCQEKEPENDVDIVVVKVVANQQSEKTQAVHRTNLSLLSQTGLLDAEFAADLGKHYSQSSKTIVHSKSEVFHPSVNKQRQHAKYLTKTFRKIIPPLQKTSKKRWIYRPEKEKRLLVQDGSTSKSQVGSSQITETQTECESIATRRSDFQSLLERKKALAMPSFEDALESGILDSYSPAEMTQEILDTAVDPSLMEFTRDPEPEVVISHLPPSLNSRYETAEMKKERNCVKRLLYCTHHAHENQFSSSISRNAVAASPPKSRGPTSSSTLKTIRSSHEMLQEQAYRLYSRKDSMMMMSKDPTRGQHDDEEEEDRSLESPPCRYLVDCDVVDRPVTAQELGLPSSSSSSLLVRAIPQGFSSPILNDDQKDDEDDDEKKKMMTVTPTKKTKKNVIDRHFHDSSTCATPPIVPISRQGHSPDKSLITQLIKDFISVDVTSELELDSLSVCWDQLNISTTRRLEFISTQCESYNDSNAGDANLMMSLEWRLAGSWLIVLSQLFGHVTSSTSLSMSSLTMIEFVRAIIISKRCIRHQIDASSQQVLDLLVSKWIACAKTAHYCEHKSIPSQNELAASWSEVTRSCETSDAVLIAFTKRMFEILKHHHNHHYNPIGDALIAVIRAKYPTMAF